MKTKIKHLLTEINTHIIKNTVYFNYSKSKNKTSWLKWKLNNYILSFDTEYTFDNT